MFTEKKYYEIDRMSRSQLVYLDQGFFKYMHKYVLKTLDEDTTAMKIGRAFHKLILEGKNQFDNEFVVGKKNTKEGKELLEKGFTLITPSEFSNIQKMDTAIKDNPYMTKYIKNAVMTESPIFYKYKDVEFKSLLDGYFIDEDDHVIFDLKTTCSHDGYDSKIMKNGGSEQIFLYSYGYEQVYGVKPKFLHFAVSKSAPFETKILDVSSFYEIGKARVNRLIELYKKFLVTPKNEIINPTLIETVLPPDWAVNEILTDEEVENVII